MGGRAPVIAVAGACVLLGAGPAPGATPGPRAGVRQPPPLAAPLLLPGDPLPHAAAARRARWWLIGARDTRAARAIAARAGARPLRLPGAYAVPRSRARAMARALAGVRALTYAEPDVAMRRLASFDGRTHEWARAAVVAPAETVPPARGRTLGIVDSGVDAAHPDLTGLVTVVRSPFTSKVVDGHGTSVASAAAGRAGGAGVTGVFPGLPVVSFALPTAFGCSQVSEGVAAVLAARAKVISLSLGSDVPCFTLMHAVMSAVAAGAVVVAAVGNEREAGNPLLFPAAFPHVLSIGSVGPSRAPSAFSGANAAVDLAAPGEGVPVAVPPAFDGADGQVDGVTTMDGTSAAAPMAAAAAAWVSAARPRLLPGQVADVLRIGAADAARPGWDPETGFGIVDVGGALRAPAPPPDPLEPNDDVALVDGRLLVRPDPAVFTGAPTALLARTDLAEDPADVYRVLLPARTAARVRVRPLFGDPDLAVFASRATTVWRQRGLVGRSTRPAGRTDALRVVNRSARRRLLYVRVSVPAGARRLDAGYRLEVVPVRRR